MKMKSAIKKIGSLLLSASILTASLGGFAVRAEEGVFARMEQRRLFHAAAESVYQLPDYIPSSFDLSENETLAKETLAKALLNGEPLVDLSPYQINYAEFINLVNFVLFTEYPSVLDISTYEYQIDNQGIIYQVKFTYHYSQAEVVARREMVGQAAEAVLSGTVSVGMTDLQKIKAVHDYLILNCAYELEENTNQSQDPDLFTAYGALIKKRAVCQGYAGAFQLLMNRLKIPCITVFSEEMNHTWNMVQVGGSWYHVDATWNDPVPDVAGRVLYNNFMRSDSGIRNGLNRHFSWESAGYMASDSQYDSFAWDAFSTPVAQNTSLTVDTRTYTGTVGKLYQFLTSRTAGTVTIRSSDPEVANVTVANADDSRGILFNLNFRNSGDAVILITSSDGGIRTIEVTVP